VFVRTSKSELPLAQLVSQLTVAMRQPTASVARAARSLFALLQVCVRVVCVCDAHSLQTLDEAPTAAGSVDLGALGLTDIVLSELRASLSAVTRPTRHVRKSVSRLHVRRVGWQRLAAVLGELVLAVLRPNVRASSGPRSFISATPLVTAALSVTSTSTAVTAAASSTTTTTTTAAAAAAAAASGAPRRPTVPPPAQLSSTYVVPSHVPPPPPKASSPNKALQTQTASSAVDTSDLDVDEDDPLADLPPSNVAPTPYDEEMRRLAAGGLVTAKPAANAMTMDDDESSESAYFSAGDAARSSVSQSAGVALAVDASGTTAPARDLASRELASAIAGDIDAVDAGDVVVVDDESETVADDESARDDTIDDDDTDSETDESAIDGASPADATPAPDSSQTTTTTSTTSTAPSMPSGAAARPAIAARRAEDTTYEVLSLYDFDGKDADELSFKAGDRIVVVHRGEAKGWWAGSMARDVQALGPDKARVGLFPSSFTSPLKRRKSSKKVASVAAQ
jgi:hypothetical protein